MKIEVSIIISSYFKSQLLDLGLYSLSNQIIKFPFEIIVLNDGIVDDTESICNKYKNKLNIKYVFTGERNLDIIAWRGLGEPFNKGVKLARGNIIILSSPEIFHINKYNITNMITPLLKNIKLITIPEGKDDNKSYFLDYLRTLDNLNKIDYSLYNKISQKLNTELPFCMGMRKETFDAMGGFDPRFSEGFCFDDNDFIDRLIHNGGEYCLVDAKIIHLYHSRKMQDRKGITDRRILFRKNEKLYLEQVELRKQEKKLKIEGKNTEYQDKWHLEKIPKIAHFYWGESTLPYLRYLTIESFIKYNPDWTVILYYPKYRQQLHTWSTYEHNYEINFTEDYYEELKQLPIQFVEIDFDSINIDNNLSEVHKSDYLRWNLLSTIGGLWSDMDIIYIDSMNHLSLNIENNKNMDTLICYDGRFKHSIGFLLSSKNNEYYKIIWNRCKTWEYNKLNYQTVGVDLLNSIMKTPESLQIRFPNLKIGNIPTVSVYPYNCSILKVIYESINMSYITNETIGFHWYAGYPRAGEPINKITHKNYTELNNVITKIIDISLKETKQEIIKNNLDFNFNKINKKRELTIHSVVKNEPFIYYSIKSVYDYADKILLYDTGSNDENTLKDIHKLLEEDIKHKIIFKQIPLDFDESKWTSENVNEFAEKYKGKMSVGKVRQMQLDNTDTEFCMIVDGDEIHYKETMNKIINEVLPNITDNIIAINIPFISFYDMNYKIINDNTGRIFRVNEVKMGERSPNHFHCFKNTGLPIEITSKRYLTYTNLMPYAHFEVFLKPWRRKVNTDELVYFGNKFPEVMEENPYYIGRFILKRK